MAFLENLKVASKVMLSLALMALIVIGTVIYASVRMYSIDSGYSGLIDQDAGMSKLLGWASQRLTAEGHLEYQLILESTPKGVDALKSRMGKNEKEFADLVTQAKAKNPGMAGRIDQIAGGFKDVLTLGHQAQELVEKSHDVEALDLVRQKIRSGFDQESRPISPPWWKKSIRPCRMTPRACPPPPATRW